VFCDERTVERAAQTKNVERTWLSADRKICLHHTDAAVRYGSNVVGGLRVGCGQQQVVRPAVFLGRRMMRDVKDRSRISGGMFRLRSVFAGSWATSSYDRRLSARLDSCCRCALHRRFSWITSLISSGNRLQQSANLSVMHSVVIGVYFLLSVSQSYL